jgi:cytochrome P450
LDLVASGFLDSLQFAGGIAVPTMILFVLPLLHMSEESKWPVLQNLTLTPKNISKVVWEVLRLYPPVGAFNYWEKDGNYDWKHIILSVSQAQRDSDVWPEPDTFKLRNTQEYSTNFIGFADFATLPPTANGGLSPHEHVCPGKLLAVAIIYGRVCENGALVCDRPREHCGHLH